jgi:nicotinate-nucleotide--dimethylbenzimidazole phosphoribosyltransferase
MTLEAVIDAIGPLGAGAMAEASAHLDRLTKPPGSLGRLEEIVVRLAGITGDPRAAVERRAIIVAAADHGVTAQGVSAYPSAVTAQMVANFVAGGAAINALAAAVGTEVTVLDVGVAASIPTVPLASAGAGASGGSSARLVEARVRSGTRDMTREPAMTPDEVAAAIDHGLTAAAAAAADGVHLLGVGEMGIGNTTAASAVVAALTGLPPAAVTGRGTGIDDAGQARKVAAIEAALARHRPDPGDPLAVLAAVGGLEIAALVGVVLGAAAAPVPLVLDGFITGAAALVAARLAPSVRERAFAGHRSVEPGHAVVLRELGLRPLLDLDLRLGEGTGAALAMSVIVAAVRARDEMATFDAAGVSGPA